MKLTRQLVTIAFAQFSALIFLILITNLWPPTPVKSTEKPLVVTQPTTSTTEVASPKPSIFVSDQIPNPSPTAPAAANPPAPATPDNRCLIVVDGEKYDITQFRSLHQGGDIFQCGTDMTTIFYSQHDTETKKKFAKYKL